MSTIRTLLAATAIAFAVPAFAQVLPSAEGQPGQAETSRVVAGTYAVDPAHTQVAWSVNHFGFSMLSGMFGASEGSMTFDPANPSAAEIDVTFPIDGIAVTYADFAGHLKSADFFDVAQYPNARFVSTSVTPGEGNGATVVGNLTIKDQTHPVTIEATFVGAGANPMDQKLNAGFHGTATIQRSQFGLGNNAPAVSDEVHLDINAAFVAE